MKLALIRFLGFLLFLALLVSPRSSTASGDPIQLRIGWQVPWATQGQLVQIWKHTDILKKHGLEATFVGRTYGPVLNELALAGEVDVILTADQPAAVLFSKNRGWVGIGRLMYNRTLTYAPTTSPIRDMAGLKGKRIGVPMGAAAERITNEALVQAGLDPQKDVTQINLGIREQGPLIGRGPKDGRWGSFDALSGFDPTPAIFEASGVIRVLDVGKVVSLVLMDEATIQSHPTAPSKLLGALRDAYLFYRENPEQANRWFMEEAGLKGANQKACELAAAIEPNLDPANAIRLSFTAEDFAVMQRAADFVSPKVGKIVPMREFVSNDFRPDGAPR